MVNGDNYLMICRLYNSKLKQVNRSEFCEIIGISFTNSNSYKKIINLLEGIIVAENRSIGCEVTIKIDTERLNAFIRSTEYYKLNETFIHKSNIFANT